MEIRKVVCILHFILQEQSKRELTVYVGIAFGCFPFSNHIKQRPKQENEETGKGEDLLIQLH